MPQIVQLAIADLSVFSARWGFSFNTVDDDRFTAYAFMKLRRMSRVVKNMAEAP